MKNHFRLLTLLVCTLVITNYCFAQCGVAPGSGITTISTFNTIINSYYPGVGNPVAGSTSVSVGSLDARAGSDILPGDLVLIIQMQGVDFDDTNTGNYGDNSTGDPASGYLSSNLYAGVYEYNVASSVTGSPVNSIFFTYPLANNYYTRSSSSTNTIQSFQVIRVPRYYDLTLNVSSSITAPAWNGITGGVVVVEVANTFTINGSVTVAGKGFRGGGGKNFVGATAGNTNGSSALSNTDYRWESPITQAANLSGGAKGEGIAGAPVYILNNGSSTTSAGTAEGYPGGAMGRGAPGNAGGGGTDGQPVGSSQNQYNTGGGGGSNAGAGGRGGSGWNGGGGDVNTFPYGGFGGNAFAHRSLQRIIMGGGGGAGTANNSDASNEANCSGGTGGGIIICRAKSYSGTGNLIADGANAPGVTISYGTAQTDAAGGGGAGGSIIVVTNQAGATGLSTINTSAIGGTGGDMTTYYDHGPGGGGGGGYIISNDILASAIVSGGANGKTRTGSTGGPIDNDFGALPGANGQLYTLSTYPNFYNANSPSSLCGTLPIQLKYFSGSYNGNDVLLTWKTGAAVNFDHFVIEYSNTGSNFSAIGSVAYQRTDNYSFIHANATGPNNFYRLKMVDHDGRFTYSPVLLLKKSITKFSAVPFQNPVHDKLILKIESDRNEEIMLDLLSKSGQLLSKQKISVKKGVNIVDMGNIDRLAAGIYIVRINASVQIKPISILKVN